jgi:hypothetical protein
MSDEKMIKKEMEEYDLFERGRVIGAISADYGQQKQELMRYCGFK